MSQDSVEDTSLLGGGMLEEAFYCAINHRRAQNMRSEHAVLAQRTTQRQVWRQALARRRVRAQTERARGAALAAVAWQLRDGR